MSNHQTIQPTGDTLTIVAPTIEAVMAQFRERRLADAGYVIFGPAVRQRFSLEAEALFDGAAMVAATFVRHH